MASPKAVLFTPEASPKLLVTEVDLDSIEEQESRPTCWAAVRQRAPQWKLQLACGLAFAHGWASLLCLIVYRTFASIMTGNVLSLATDCFGAIPLWAEHISQWNAFATTLSTAYYRQQCAVHGSVFASYCLGLALYRVINTLLGRWASASAIALICSSLFVAVDVTRMYVTTSAFEVSFAAVALGIVNAVAIKVHGLTTHMITIHTQKMVLTLMDLFFEAEFPDAKCKGLRETTALVASFAGGAAGGAASMAIPIDNWRFSALGALFFLLLCAHDFVYHAAMADIKLEAALQKADARAAVVKAARATFSGGSKSAVNSGQLETPSASGQLPTPEGFGTVELVSLRARSDDTV